jgi:allantoinase
MAQDLDLVIKNLRVVRPGARTVEALDIGIKDGRFARIDKSIPVADSKKAVDGLNRLAFPGCVDAHMHVGIYQPLEDDAVAESKAAAMGGVTTSLNYFRTGQYYLNKGGPWREFMPEVARRAQGRFFVDYGFHMAPIEARHIDEMHWLAAEWGVPSFKIFMFYGGYGLHGRSSDQSEFLMIAPEERYDIAHFEFIMRSARRLMERLPELAPYVSVSLHCELAEILNAYTRIVERDGSLSGLRAYSAARPPHSEGLAVWIAAYLANETDCTNINLLHLSSKKAIDAALAMQQVFPQVSFRREVTIGHLLLDTDCECGVLAKVNPPIRPRADVEALWEALLGGKVDWVVSDHACCSSEKKYSAQFPKDIWLAKAGFGGTEWLLSGLLSEGRKRGMSYNRIAELLSWNPAQRFGLLSKGDIDVGFDADLALVDETQSFVVRAADSESNQGYTPFEGLELTGRVTATYLRGALVYDNGNIVGAPRGQYLRRPTGIL